MAIGDDAAAAGYDIVADTDEVNEGALELNRTRDYIAQEKTARIAGDALAFPASKVIVSATTPTYVAGAIWLKPLS